jgi:hypothetical protein
VAHLGNSYNDVENARAGFMVQLPLIYGLSTHMASLKTLLQMEFGCIADVIDSKVVQLVKKIMFSLHGRTWLQKVRQQVP